MQSGTVRKWEYKGLILEVKGVHLLDAAQVEMIKVLHGDLDSLLEEGHYCGYATASKDLGNCELAKHLEDYGHPDVDVHGGVSYFTDNGGTVTYGFDCAHYQDALARWDLDAVSQECQNLANEIRRIAGITD